MTPKKVNTSVPPITRPVSWRAQWCVASAISTPFHPEMQNPHSANTAMPNACGIATSQLQASIVAMLTAPISASTAIPARRRSATWPQNTRPAAPQAWTAPAVAPAASSVQWSSTSMLTVNADSDSCSDE